MELINNKNNKILKQYKKLFLKFANLKDEFGGIDKKILKAVVVLNLLNIPTISSCEGHIKNASPVPYIKIAPRRKVKNYKSLIQKYKFQINKFLRLFYKKRKVKSDIRLVITNGNYGFWLHPDKKLFLKWRKIVNQQVLINKIKNKNCNYKINKKINYFKIKNKQLFNYQKEFDLFAEFLFNYYLNNRLQK